MPTRPTTQTRAHNLTLTHVDAPAGVDYPGCQNPRLNDIVVFAAPDAALLWHNRDHPCTDLWPWLGDIEPGQEKAAEGWLLFLEGEAGPDEVLAWWRHGFDD